LPPARARSKLKPPPAATDIEATHGGFDLQFGDDVLFFMLLRFVEAGIGIGEISTGILQILIQKQPIQIIAEIVMSMDIGF